MEHVREWAILDSGATSHLLVSTAPMSNIQPSMTPLAVKLPDSAHIKSTTTCILALPDLPAKLWEAHIIPGFSHHSLLSVVTSCNAGCNVKFTAISCYVKYWGKIVMKGAKCTKTGLCMVPLSKAILQSPTEMQKIAYKPMMFSSTPVSASQERGYSIIKTSTLAELAIYHHQTLCLPPKSTLLKAIANFQLKSFPGAFATIHSKRQRPHVMD